MNGWLSPHGEYIQCEPYQHDKIARAHGDSEVKWENIGYVKIFNGGIENMWYCNRFLTDAQEKWLIDNNMAESEEID